MKNWWPILDGLLCGAMGVAGFFAIALLVWLVEQLAKELGGATVILAAIFLIGFVYGVTSYGSKKEDKANETPTGSSVDAGDNGGAVGADSHLAQD